MVEHQFSPGQLLEGQFSSPGVFQRLNFYQNAVGIGLTAGLQLSLDAGAAASYTSGQSFLDLSGNGYDFFLGTIVDADSRDPTFNGVAGSLSANEYFSTDGADFFRYDSANEAWMNRLHQDNAKWALALWFYYTTTSARFVGNANGGSSIGLVLQTNANRPRIVVRGGGGITSLDVTASSGLALTDNAWNFVAYRIDEAAGASGSHFVVNGVTQAFNATYTTPSAAGATDLVEFLSQGAAGTPTLVGQRLAGAWWWEGTIPSVTNLTDLYTRSRKRFI